jgi:hypothetical protein
VQVQHVELDRHHAVNHRADQIERLEMARRVDHQPAPGKARRIGQRHGGQADRAFARRPGELLQAHRAIEQAVIARRRDNRAARRHGERMGFLPSFPPPRRARADGADVAFHHAQGQAVLRGEARGEQGGRRPGGTSPAGTASVAPSARRSAGLCGVTVPARQAPAAGPCPPSARAPRARGTQMPRAMPAASMVIPVRACCIPFDPAVAMPRVLPLLVVTRCREVTKIYPIRQPVLCCCRQKRDSHAWIAALAE